MNRKWTRFLVFSLIAVLFCGCGAVNSSTTTEQDDIQEVAADDAAYEEEMASHLKNLYDFKNENVFSIKNYKEYMPLASISGLVNGSYATIVPDDEFDFPQGGCTDGKYVYLAMTDDNSTFKITKVDMKTWEIVDRSEALYLGHANGMTYNSRTHQLVIANDTANHYKEIFFMNPDTLTITGEKTLTMDIATIAYNATRDQYIVADNSEHFYVLDADFYEILYDDGHYVNLSPQDCDCDDNYIYIGNTGVSKDPGLEVVKVYSWDGEYKGIFKMELQQEHEALFNYDGKYYVTFVMGKGVGIWEIQYDFNWLAQE